MRDKNKKSFLLLKKNNLLPLIAGGIVFLIIFSISEWLIEMDDSVHDEQYQARVDGSIKHISHQLQEAINNNLLVIETVESLLLLQTDITSREFNIIAENLLATRPSIKQIELSPDAIIKFIYPLSDQSGVGLNLRSIPGQKDIVEQSIQQQKMIMAGPLELLEGGIALIVRQPLYKTDQGNTQFWGFITLLFDLDKLFTEAELLGNDHLTQYAIRGADAQGKDGEIFFGEPRVFASRHLSTLINVPGGHWILAASINDYPHTPYHSYLSIWGLLASAAFGLLTWFSTLLWLRTYQRSIHDPLTGLLNRQYFQKRTKIEIERAKRHNLPLSLIMIDLDLFKQINDNFGHQAGDHILRLSAQLIQESLREGDEVGRYGGEEFVVITPHDNEIQAQQCAERIRLQLDRQIVINEQTVKLSASLGVASLSRNASDYDQLIYKADEALYQAKAKGRNCIVTAGKN